MTSGADWPCDRTVPYTYDNLYRLTSETISGDASPTPQNGAINYSYDAVGNRAQMTSTVPAVPAGLFFYDANDRLSTDTYDANGNTTGSGGSSVAYDFENHLVQKDNVQVLYDGDGVRVAKKIGTQTTWFLTAEHNLTGYAQVIHEETTPAAGSSFVPTRQYVYGLDLIAQRRSTGILQPHEVRFYAYDGHGSTRQLTDSAGAITDTYDYDAFGNLISRTGSTPNHYLYAGEQFDPDLNLYFLRARYLDVRTARFWSADSFEGQTESPLSLHRYLYAGSDPVNATDPTGLFTLQEQSESLGIQTTLRSQSTQTATKVIKRATEQKIADVYFLIGFTGRRVLGIPFLHSFIFVNTRVLNEGVRYDVGPDTDSLLGLFSGATVPGFVQRSISTLTEASRGSLRYKVASFSVAQLAFYTVSVIAIPVEPGFLTLPYSLAPVAGTFNCVTWSIKAALAAKVVERIPF